MFFLLAHMSSCCCFAFWVEFQHVLNKPFLLLFCMAWISFCLAKWTWNCRGPYWSYPLLFWWACCFCFDFDVLVVAVSVCFGWPVVTWPCLRISSCFVTRWWEPKHPCCHCNRWSKKISSEWTNCGCWQNEDAVVFVQTHCPAKLASSQLCKRPASIFIQTSIRQETKKGIVMTFRISLLWRLSKSSKYIIYRYQLLNGPANRISMLSKKQIYSHF